MPDDATQDLIAAWRAGAAHVSRLVEGLPYDLPPAVRHDVRTGHVATAAGGASAADADRAGR